MHRTRLALSQLKGLLWLRPGSGIPSISTAYAQARRRCAQVIHMFVHRRQGSSPVAGLPSRPGVLDSLVRLAQDGDHVGCPGLQAAGAEFRDGQAAADYGLFSRGAGSAADRPAGQSDARPGRAAETHRKPDATEPLPAVRRHAGYTSPGGQFASKKCKIMTEQTAPPTRYVGGELESRRPVRRYPDRAALHAVTL